jgi:hypothetical protein
LLKMSIVRAVTHHTSHITHQMVDGYMKRDSTYMTRERRYMTRERKQTLPHGSMYQLLVDVDGANGLGFHVNVPQFETHVVARQDVPAHTHTQQFIHARG